MSHRELAYQIAEQFRVLGKPLGLRDCIIVGGMGKIIATNQICSCEWCTVAAGVHRETV